MSNTRKLTIISILFLLTALCAVILFAIQSNNQTTPTTSTSSADSVSNLSPDKLIIGSPGAKVTIVEYADFKCPQCGKFHQTSGQQIRQEYIDSGQANIEFRAYPFIGPDSARALRGAYCANELGAFTDYHDDVFDYMWENYYKNGDFKVEIEDILTEGVLTDIASRAGADKAKFSSCIATEDKNKLIDRDLEQSTKDSVEGTPTFIIGDQKIVGPLPFNNFKTLIDINLR
ncbi:DsbA family protein [Candidatus Saccharibacteria bacterium]|nr:DsbA family protein [Candidatus Saccharibacteria bacterium]